MFCLFTPFELFFPNNSKIKKDKKDNLPFSFFFPVDNLQQPNISLPPCQITVILGLPLGLFFGCFKKIVFCAFLSNCDAKLLMPFYIGVAVLCALCLCSVPVLCALCSVLCALCSVPVPHALCSVSVLCAVRGDVSLA